MSTLHWLRIARRYKIYKQPEYPNIETLIEADHDKPAGETQLLAKIIPAGIVVFGLGMAILATIVNHNAWYLLTTLGSGVFGVAAWIILDQLAKKTPASRVLVRKRLKTLEQRICGLSNLVGIEPAMSPEVAAIIDEAAGIYIKHREEEPGAFADNRARATTALEEAMAKILELVEQPTLRNQEFELQKGWAQPLLQEMRDLDKALDENLRSSLANPSRVDDPLAQLRQARLELQSIDTAIDELEQRH